MSLSLFSETRIGLFAGLCGAVRLDGWRKRRVAAVTAVRCAAPDAAQPVPAALDAALGRAPSRRAQVVLGSTLNRYLVLPAAPALRRETEWAALARARATQIHGGQPDRWRVTLSPRIGRVRVAALIDGAFLERLVGQFAASGIRVVSAVPYLSLGLQRFPGGEAGAARHWIALAEPGAVTCIAMADEAPVRIVVQRWHGHGIDRIAQQLAREQLLLGWPAEEAPVVWAGCGALDAAVVGPLHAEPPAAALSLLEAANDGPDEERARLLVRLVR